MTPTTWDPGPPPWYCGPPQAPEVADVYEKFPLTFYTTTHHAGWLWNPAADFELCVSRRNLARYKTLRPATHDWFCDSGGFTELSKFGRWTITPREYVGLVARFDDEIGSMGWAAPMDWMCEPDIIAGGGPHNYPGTHLSVAEHQRRTVANFIELRDLWPSVSNSECPFMPVLQGWEPDDYLRCADLYDAAGIRLEDYPVTGLGSVCRKQGTKGIALVVARLTPWLALHGFGVSSRGLPAFGHLLTCADSLAWSLAAMHEPPLPGHEDRHQHCNNCLPFAKRWRNRLLASIADADARGHQGDLFAGLGSAA